MNIADLRQEYMRAGLSEADAHADPLVQFERWFKDALDANLTREDIDTQLTGYLPAARPKAMQANANFGIWYVLSRQSSDCNGGRSAKAISAICDRSCSRVLVYAGVK